MGRPKIFSSLEPEYLPNDIPERFAVQLSSRNGHSGRPFISARSLRVRRVRFLRVCLRKWVSFSVGRSRHLTKSMIKSSTPVT